MSKIVPDSELINQSESTQETLTSGLLDRSEESWYHQEAWTFRKANQNPVPEFINPRFRENKPKTLVFSHWKRAFWACFRENRVYNFRHDSHRAGKEPFIILVSDNLRSKTLDHMVMTNWAGKLVHRDWPYIRDIERSALSLVMQTSSKSFRPHSVPTVVWGVMWEGKSMPRICKSSYGGKLFSKICSSLYTLPKNLVSLSELLLYIACIESC